MRMKFPSVIGGYRWELSVKDVTVGAR
jgi:hypothetical protein